MSGRCNFCTGGVIAGGTVPEGNCLVGLGEGGQEKELAGTQTILWKESWSLVCTDLKNFFMLYTA